MVLFTSVEIFGLSKHENEFSKSCMSLPPSPTSEDNGNPAALVLFCKTDSQKPCGRVTNGFSGMLSMVTLAWHPHYCDYLGSLAPGGDVGARRCQSLHGSRGHEKWRENEPKHTCTQNVNIHQFKTRKNKTFPV